MQGDTRSCTPGRLVRVLGTQESRGLVARAFWRLDEIARHRYRGNDLDQVRVQELRSLWVEGTVHEDDVLSWILNEVARVEYRRLCKGSQQLDLF